MFKDDFIYISYDKPIVPAANLQSVFKNDRYTNHKTRKSLTLQCYNMYNDKINYPRMKNILSSRDLFHTSEKQTFEPTVPRNHMVFKTEDEKAINFHLIYSVNMLTVDCFKAIIRVKNKDLHTACAR